MGCGKQKEALTGLPVQTYGDPPSHWQLTQVPPRGKLPGTHRCYVGVPRGSAGFSRELRISWYPIFFFVFYRGTDVFPQKETVQGRGSAGSWGRGSAGGRRDPWAPSSSSSKARGRWPPPRQAWQAPARPRKSGRDVAPGKAWRRALSSRSRARALGMKQSNEDQRQKEGNEGIKTSQQMKLNKYTNKHINK